jgi:hypothetical protein
VHWLTATTKMARCTIALNPHQQLDSANFCTVFQNL